MYMQPCKVSHQLLKCKNAVFVFVFKLDFVTQMTVNTSLVPLPGY